MKKKGGGLSIAAMILGIVGVLLSCIYIGILPCIIGLIFAIVALAKNLPQKGMAIAGLITSIVGVIIFLFSILIPGTDTSNNDSNTNDVQKEVQIEYVDESELKLIYTDTDKYEGKHVKMYLQLLDNAEYDDSSVYFQGFADIENSTLNTLIQYDDPTLELVGSDYVYVDGVIVGSYSGENAFGGKVTAVKVLADHIEKVNYIDAVAPTIKEFSDIEPQEQHGCSVTIDKIEIAKTETRVYVTVSNTSENAVSIFDYDAKLIQDGKQYETTANYDADYETLPSNIMGGVTASGIITFDKIAENSSFEIIIGAYSDNYSLDFEDFKFTIN